MPLLLLLMLVPLIREEFSFHLLNKTNSLRCEWWTGWSQSVTNLSQLSSDINLSPPKNPQRWFRGNFQQHNESKSIWYRSAFNLHNFHFCLHMNLIMRTVSASVDIYQWKVSNLPEGAMERRKPWKDAKFAWRNWNISLCRLLVTVKTKFTFATPHHTEKQNDSVSLCSFMRR